MGEYWNEMGYVSVVLDALVVMGSASGLPHTVSIFEACLFFWGPCAQAQGHK